MAGNSGLGEQAVSEARHEEEQSPKGIAHLDFTQQKQVGRRRAYRNEGSAGHAKGGAVRGALPEIQNGEVDDDKGVEV